MNKIMRLFCRHHSCQVICWHWTHGLNDNEPAFIEMQLRCKKCNKLYFRYIKDPKEFDCFVSTHKDTQWSDTCKPILNMRYYEEENNND